jgi:enamine deaminase RidA (YjgF/YER057c/UK114 family)
MAGAVESKLNALGITLKEPAKPIANYVAYVRTGNLLTVSGQLCFGGDGNSAPACRSRTARRRRGPAPSA